MMTDYKVDMINDGMQEFHVQFNGPKESNYFLNPQLLILNLFFELILGCLFCSYSFMLLSGFVIRRCFDLV